jgi:hypothetical protein
LLRLLVMSQDETVETYQILLMLTPKWVEEDGRYHYGPLSNLAEHRRLLFRLPVGRWAIS